MFGEQSSAFWFHGRLTPSNRVPPIDVQEVVVAEGVYLEIICDGIGVWARPGGAEFKQPGEATALFELVAAAYALETGQALGVQFDGWVEATEASLGGSVVGFHLNRPPDAPEVDRNSDASVIMRRAAQTAVAVHSRPLHRLAIRDLHTALGDSGDDAYLYAYRAIEGLARALSGAEGQLGRQDWDAFHRARSITPEYGQRELSGLTAARHAVAHGDTEATAHADRAGVLAHTRMIVTQVLDAEGLRVAK